MSGDVTRQTEPHLPDFHRTGRVRSPPAHTRCDHSWRSCWWVCASGRGTHRHDDRGAARSACPALRRRKDLQTCFSFLWRTSCHCLGTVKARLCDKSDFIQNGWWMMYSLFSDQWEFWPPLAPALVGCKWSPLVCFDLCVWTFSETLWPCLVTLKELRDYR